MKKLLFFSVVIGFMALAGVVISAHAAQNQPPFFIPQKVLDKMNQPEKLPPVDQMTYDNRLAPNVIEKKRQEAAAEKQRQQELAQERRINEQKKRAEELAQKRRQEMAAQEKTKAPEKTPESIKPDTPRQAENKPAFKLTPVQTTQTAKKTEPTAAEPKQTPVKKQTIISSKTPVADSPQQTSEPPGNLSEMPVVTAPLNNSQRTFDDIIADYKRDANDISKGKPVNNPRLRDVLQDYSDERHIL